VNRPPDQSVGGPLPHLTHSTAMLGMQHARSNNNCRLETMSFVTRVVLDTNLWLRHSVNDLPHFRRSLLASRTSNHLVRSRWSWHTANDP